MAVEAEYAERLVGPAGSSSLSWRPLPIRWSIWRVAVLPSRNSFTTLCPCSLMGGWSWPQLRASEATISTHRPTKWTIIEWISEKDRTILSQSCHL
eukprot:scaffold474787_cov49-Prasinocladus_malaysianus.AAC.3